MSKTDVVAASLYAVIKGGKKACWGLVESLTVVRPSKILG